jgi:hypothetical protein
MQRCLCLSGALALLASHRVDLIGRCIARSCGRRRLPRGPCACDRVGSDVTPSKPGSSSGGSRARTQGQRDRHVSVLSLLPDCTLRPFGEKANSTLASFFPIALLHRRQCSRSIPRLPLCLTATEITINCANPTWHHRCRCRRAPLRNGSVDPRGEQQQLASQPLGVGLRFSRTINPAHALLPLSRTACARCA